MIEQDLAILIADLSGYTALTETHGASSAADLIDKYTGIVQECLVGGSHLHQCIGDEVIIISESPDDLIATAIILLERTSNEHHFLQVHGALHYGKLLKRNDSYFGSTINLTSRIASQAAGGRFWFSEEYINAISDKSAFKFESKGRFSFKNVSDEKEVFELVVGRSQSRHIDPVCRMLLVDKEKLVSHPTRKELYFCSQHCLEIYLRNETNSL